MPDWCTVDFEEVTAYPDRKFNFGFDATRIPLRTGHDYVTNGQSSPGNSWLAQWNNNRLSNWAKNSVSFQPAQLGAFYELDGENLGGNNTAAVVGSFAVAAMVHPSQQAWLNNLYERLLNMDTRTVDKRYFTSCMRVFSMLIVTGNMPVFE